MFNRTRLMLVVIVIVLQVFHTGVLAQKITRDGEGKSEFGSVEGQVLDKETEQPLIGTNIVIVGTSRGGSTDLNGKYMITHLPPGEYVIEFYYMGYRTERIESFRIPADSTAHLDVGLEPQPLRLSEIIVTPGQFAVMGRQPIVQQTLTKQNLETVPFGEDVYRAITRLPGVSSGDYSAKFAVRGGKNEEILVLMDGQELYEPFHLKDVDGGVLSIINVEAIEEIDLYTGGYPAEHGECLSGVFGMKSTGTGGGESRTSLGMSFMNAGFMSQGNFQENKGSWLVSARRGYLDLVLSLMGEEDAPQPIYYDLFGKVKYKSNNNTISANVLHSGDKLGFEEDDGDKASTRYGNSYGWLTWTSIMNPRLFVRTMASFGRVTHNRQGIGYFDDVGDLEFTVSDDNRVDFYGLKQDWDFEPFERWLLRWGLYFDYETADYDYLSTLAHLHWIDQSNYFLDIDTTSTNLNPDGERFGGYLTNRLRILNPLTVEVGLRYDRNAYTGDRYLSPRFNTVYALGNQTFLRGGWGYFYQSQRMHEIKVAYGETDFYPGQLSKHWVAGLEHTSRGGLNLRMEAYYKKISDLRPEHRTFSNAIEIFPEIEEDVFTLDFNKAKSKGLEFYMKYDQGRKLSLWTSYALAYADEDVRSITHQGETSALEEPIIPNRYDQRHTIYLDLNYRPDRNWHLNVSWQYHTGWPYTQKVMRSRQLPDGSTEYYAEYENLYGSRLPSYHRMDLQVNRHFYLSRSRISLFLAVINLYDHGNVRNVKYNQRRDPDGILYLAETREYWFPLLPSLGIRWTWTH